MTVKFGFYNSKNGDRTYDAEDFGGIFDGVIRDGVYRNYLDSLEAKPNGGMSIRIGSGRAWFDHTWTYNTTSLPFDVPASHPSYSRIDVVCLKVDKSSNRENSIVYKTGNPSSSPTKPIITKNSYIKEYPLCYITVRPNSRSIEESDIESMIGTEETPIVTGVASSLETTVENNILERLDSLDGGVNHMNLYRGKNLGNRMTREQSKAIKDGTFEGLYLGDYWVHDDAILRIVDFDYLYKRGSQGLDKHHIVIMTDEGIGTSAMSYSSSTSGGFYNSVPMRANLSSMTNKFHNDYASVFSLGDFMLHFKDYMSKDLASNGAVIGGDWKTIQWTIPSFESILGYPSHTPTSATSALMRPSGMFSTQFRAMAVNPNLIFNTSGYWVRNICNNRFYGGITYDGIPWSWPANEYQHLRIMFLVGGK